MKMLLSLTLTFGLIGMATAEDKNDPTNGKWVVESVTKEGKTIDGYKGSVRANDNGKYSFTPPADSKFKPSTGTYTIDTTKSPITFDIKPKGGTYDGKTLLGIAKVDGDTMTIAFAEPGKDRPAKFESPEGSAILVTVYKKAK